MAASPDVADSPLEGASLGSRLRLLPRGLLLTVVCVMMASAAALVLSEISFDRTVAKAAKVTALLDRLDAIADFRNLMVDVETGQRGFLLTRDPAYLEPYEAARSRITPALNRLGGLTPGDEGQAGVEAIRATAAERLALASRSVGVARGGDFTAAAGLLEAGAGKASMDRLRAELAALEGAAEAELAMLRATDAGDTFWPRIATLVSTMLVFVLLLAVTRLVLDESARQRAYARDREQEAARMQQLVAARTADLSALSAHVQTVAEREKAELARNLHDELGGLLTAARMDIAWLQGATQGLDPSIAAKLVELNQAFTQAMDVKRRVVESLRPALLDHFGLPTAMQNHFEEVCRKAGLDCSTHVTDEIGKLPEDLAIAIFRVGQESLTNIVRHARARRVELEFDVVDGVIAVHIRDDGIGMDAAAPPAAGSHGIPGMRQRIQSLGGSFLLASEPGRGTEVLITIPLPA